MKERWDVTFHTMHRDNLRIQKGIVTASERSKKMRKFLRAQRKRKGDKSQETEGITYAAGTF